MLETMLILVPLGHSAGDLRGAFEAQVPMEYRVRLIDGLETLLS